MLSSRGLKNVNELGRPWRFTPTATYDPDMYPEGLISFGMAENKPMREEIVRYINEKVVFTLDSISYRSSSRMAARFPMIAGIHLDTALKTCYNIDPEHIVVADSPTSLGNMLGYNLAERGQGVLVSRPVYGRFELDYGVQAGVEIVYADNTVDEAFTPSIVARFEEALVESKKRGIKIRALLHVNPHNPTGRCTPVATLIAILQFCNSHKLHLISDEVYASCSFPTANSKATPFTSILSLDLESFIDPKLVHVLYGFSKDFASGGLRIGFLITRNEALRKACKMMSRFHSPSQTALTIAMAILEDQDFVFEFTAKSNESLAASYKLVTSTLDQENINYVREGAAGFFVYVDFSPFLKKKGEQTVQEQEFSLAKRFVDAGVFFHPGEEHGKDPGWFRLVFSQDEGTLKEGLRRMLGVLKGCQ